MMRRLKFYSIRLVLFMLVLPIISYAQDQTEKRPNVLFIAVDDLNHWVGYTGRNPQVKTPNIDRLSKMGVSFTNAHTIVPSCNPSRAALMTGMRPSTTGCYSNYHQPFTDYFEEGQGLESHFHDNGYKTMAKGKIYHGARRNGGYKSGWDDYPPLSKPISLGGGAEGGGFLDGVTTQLEDEDLGDWETVDYCTEQLQKDHEKPFFLACGIYKPHLSWVVPQKYYDMFPVEDIQLPPYLEGDLNDVPDRAKTLRKYGDDHRVITEKGRWKEAIQAYLATIAYADMNVGRVLDALETSRYKDNTIIVLWGDHGWSLGEKDTWRKFTLWEEATRSPLIWVAPGITKAKSTCDKPVDFLTIYPTLCELAGLPIPEHVEGKSLVSLLKDPDSEWDQVAVTTYGYMNHTVRTDRWRYIKYDDGSEELYDHSTDKYEWHNLASDPAYKKVKKKLAMYFPKENKISPIPEDKRSKAKNFIINQD